jgi:hypothetical protein
MSVAALATSWAGYQASLFNGDQLAYGDSATALRTTATRNATRAGQERIVDLELFTSWLGAYARRDSVLSRFYQERFRPEFAPAFRTWVASRPLVNPGAARTPFALPEYRLASDADAQRLSRLADEASAASRHANMTSDAYVLTVVILATVMFFATASQRDTASVLRIGLIILAFLMCTAALYRLFTSPRG